MILRRRIVTLLLSFFFVFGSVSLFAQETVAEETASGAASEDEAWYYGATIKSVSFKGLKRY